MTEKAEGAFLTISELSDALGLPQHILRYWETRFPQLRPLQRAGKRRYYRPEDVALAGRINRLLNQEGYTIKGVQKLLDEDAGAAPEPVAASREAPAALLAELRVIRDTMAEALAADSI